MTGVTQGPKWSQCFSDKYTFVHTVCTRPDIMLQMRGYWHHPNKEKQREARRGEEESRGVLGLVNIFCWSNNLGCVRM